MVEAPVELKHSVAFRVDEQVWRKLHAEAEKSGMTVPQLAKLLLFERIGVTYEPRRSKYGQKKR